MTSENTRTGRHGKMKVDNTQVARLTQWDVSPTLATKSEWGDSDGGGYTNRAAGRRDNTFSCEGKYDSGTAGVTNAYDIFQPEDIAQATLFMNAVAPFLYWDFPRALCDDFGLTVNVDSEEVIGWTAGFGADGIFYRPGQDGAPARTL